MVIKIRNRGRGLNLGWSQYLSDPVKRYEIPFNTVHQYMESENHDISLMRKHNKTAGAGDVWDIGGDFLSQKIEIDISSLSYQTASESIYKPYGVPFSVVHTMFLPSNRFYSALVLQRKDETLGQYAARIRGLTPAPLSSFKLDAAGTTAISRVIPTNPAVDLATSVSETISAKSLFSAPGKALKKGDVSGEYLNLQLGILPVIADVRDTWQAAKDSEAILQQYERGSGRLTRRRYVYPTEENITSVQEKDVFCDGFGVSFSSYNVKPGTLTTTTREVRDTWFSGAFTYLAPKSGWRRTLAHYERLYGVIPGLETAWNVIPYSFVADYFANTGDMLHNMDRFAKDGLVMPYGYVMSTNKTVVHQVWRGSMYVNGVPRELVLSGSITYTTKQRRRANPFGFGLTEGDLSLRQVSILAALGLNRR